MEKMRNACNILVGEPEGKSPLRRLGRRWEDNIRTDLWATRWEDVDRIHLAQDTDHCQAFVVTVMNLLVP
jgi:hypothetical protein